MMTLNRNFGHGFRTHLAVAIGLTLAATVASATTVTFGGTAFGPMGASSTVAGAQVQDFESGLPSNYTFSAGDTLNGIFAASVPGVAAAPTNDTSHFLATGIGSLTINFANPTSYFGLLWGSVDSYNSITFNSGAASQTFTGTDILSDPGFMGLNGSAYVNFFATPGTTWDSVVLSSSKANFELDNVATSATPEPASYALFGAGIVLAGLMISRRKNSQFAS